MVAHNSISCEIIHAIFHKLWSRDLKQNSCRHCDNKRILWHKTANRNQRKIQNKKNFCIPPALKQCCPQHYAQTKQSKRKESGASLIGSVMPTWIAYFASNELALKRINSVKWKGNK